MTDRDTGDKPGHKPNHKAEEIKGKVKDKVGKVTGNRSLEAEGKTDVAKAKAKQLADEAKERARRATE